MKVAVPFYSEDNFIQMKALLPKEGWPRFYDDWLEQTERSERTIVAAGNLPVRIDVDPTTFEAWCKTRNQQITRPAILNYCMFLLVANLGQLANKG